MKTTKKTAIIFLFITCLLITGAKTIFAFSGNGSGTETDPYQITTCTQLQEMKDDFRAYYLIVNDIDCSDTKNWNDGKGFEPVGNTTTGRFIGGLQSDNSVISSLYINRPDEDNVGLFGYTASIPSKITNVGLENVDISGQNNVGGLVGRNYGVTIANCYVTGSVTGSGDYVGGLMGYHKLVILHTQQLLNSQSNRKRQQRGRISRSSQ